MERLYATAGIDELEALVSGGNRGVASAVLEELANRRGERAEKLRARILTLVARGECARVRPPGTPGLPQVHRAALKQTVELEVQRDATVVDRYVAALAILIDELRQSDRRKRVRLEGGVRLECRPGKDGGEASAVYRFDLPDDNELTDETRVDLDIGGRRIAGRVMSLRSRSVKLAVAADLGEALPGLTVLIDESAFLEKLREKLLAVKDGELELNRALADAVVGADGRPGAVAQIRAPQGVRLNPSQMQARRRVLGQALTYIWGPPGCGKTYTLSDIVLAAFSAGKRILICSNTNKAVDQVLYRICSTLGADHEALQAGQVVRLGRIADDKLREEFAGCIVPDDIEARLGRELHARRQALLQEMSALRERIDDGESVTAVFEAMSVFMEDSLAHTRRAEAARQQHLELSGMLKHSQRKLGELSDEFTRAGGWRGILKRSAKKIQEDLARESTSGQSCGNCASWTSAARPAPVQPLPSLYGSAAK